MSSDNERIAAPLLPFKYPLIKFMLSKTTLESLYALISKIPDWLFPFSVKLLPFIDIFLLIFIGLESVALL